MKKQIKFILLSLFLILITCGSISLTAKSMDKQRGNNQKHYDILEKKYQESIQDTLEENLIFQSGITMTRMTDEDGNRSYTIQIYNSRFHNMSDEELKELSQKIEDICIPEFNAQVQQEFVSDTLL